MNRNHRQVPAQSVHDGTLMTGSAGRLSIDRLFIGGDWVTPATSGMLDIVSPSTEEHYASVVEAQTPDIDRAVAAARQAFDTGPWSRMTAQERAPYLVKIAAGIEARAAELAHTWTSETGTVDGFGERRLNPHRRCLSRLCGDGRELCLRGAPTNGNRPTARDRSEGTGGVWSPRLLRGMRPSY